MWINYKWEPESADEPPQAILSNLSDNANDQSIDAFYFDDDDAKVYLIQSKYSNDWYTTKRITYPDLKRTADIIRYFESPNETSVVYQQASEKCRKLLAKALRKRNDDGYDIRIVLASNRLEPDEKNLEKLEEQTRTDLSEWDFEVIPRARLIRLYAEFLEGHNPPIPSYFIETTDDRYLYVSEPKRDIEAYTAYVRVDELIKVYQKFGDRVFEKNIRAFQGDTSVNDGIIDTIKHAPDLFFFRNSGVTMLVDKAEPVPKKYDQPPGFKVKDIQIINGQQTVKMLAKKNRVASVLTLTIMAPCKQNEKGRSKASLEDRREMITDIIAARNFQNKIGYADLKSNRPEQVVLWREFKKKGYYYERKKKGWANLDFYARGIYRLAEPNGWARIRKEDLAAEIIALFDDPQTAYKGADYIFKERYDEVFAKGKPQVDWYLALHLLSKKYIYRIGHALGETYPQYHILSFMWKQLGVKPKNAQEFRVTMEEEKGKSLENSIKILYKLSKQLIEEEQKKTDKPLSYNDVFGKRTGMLRTMDSIFKSKKFSKQRKQFRESLAKFEVQVKKTADSSS